MKRKGIKKLGLCLAAVLVCAQISFVSLAYFDRGDVKVRLGKSSVSLEAGESESVTVSISPSSDRQLPGGIFIGKENKRWCISTSLSATTS